MVISPIGTPTALLLYLSTPKIVHKYKQLWAKAIIEAYKVERELYVCNFYYQGTGQFSKVKKN